MQILPQINAVKIVEEINTAGSSPLFIIADDGEEYYVKMTIGQPAIEIINEILCAFFLKLLQLNVPDFAVAKVSDEVFQKFKEDGGILSARYGMKSFDQKIFFASKRLSPIVELENYYIGSLAKKDFYTIESALDIIKIGIFDMWVGNKDRKVENPNILLHAVNELVRICPIDHTAAFAHCTDYRQVNNTFLFLEEKFRILNMPLIKNIAKHSQEDEIRSIERNMLEGMDVVIQSIDSIFAHIPKELGFSKKAKEHLKDFLSDKDRNGRLAKSYIGYLK